MDSNNVTTADASTDVDRGRINAKRKVTFTHLPRATGGPYYSYAARRRQFGRQRTIRALLRACALFSSQYPLIKVGIGDISLEDGAPIPAAHGPVGAVAHKAHRKGLNVDVRPCRIDGSHGRTSFRDATYSRECTQALVDALLAQPEIVKVYFNDPSVRGVKPLKGHDDHLHVEFSPH